MRPEARISTTAPLTCCVISIALLPDYLIGLLQHRRRNRQAEAAQRCFVEHQLRLRHCFEWNRGGLFAAHHARRHEAGGTSVLVIIASESADGASLDLAGLEHEDRQPR